MNNPDSGRISVIFDSVRSDSLNNTIFSFAWFPLSSSLLFDFSVSIYKKKQVNNYSSVLFQSIELFIFHRQSCNFEFSICIYRFFPIMHLNIKNLMPLIIRLCFITTFMRCALNYFSYVPNQNDFIGKSENNFHENFLLTRKLDFLSSNFNNQSILSVHFILQLVLFNIRWINRL